jgi:tRNA-specific 2-thiouridylase
MPKKVICAMSGGVDSSVAAALLKKQGFEVVGVFMKLWPEKYFSETAQRRVKRICSKLGIPFLVFNLTKEFKKKVVDYFLREYQRGRTPNPCVKCNKDLKFGIFFKKALASGADFIATGHYAQIKNYKLLAAKDREKDQSYFLYNLKQSQLKKILFPVGNYTKSGVKKLAEDFGLINLVRPESRDICFLAGRHQDFLKKHLKLKPGLILNTSGKKIGQHQGLPLYTIGQRKEIEIPDAFPYYVLKLDFKNNTLIVTDNEKDLYKKELIAEKVNWVSGKIPKLPLKIKAKIRYLHPASSATITKTLAPRTYNLKFNRPQRAITPGQSVVFYGRQEVLGGGVIK